MDPIESNNIVLSELIQKWEQPLRDLPEEIISGRRNKQGRNIRQILGHMIDSASNNLHRTIHLQYRESPLIFPNYASFGNNDRWIAIQNYEKEDWSIMVSLWKYSNIHIIHVFRNVNPDKFKHVWEADKGKFISLYDGIVDYHRHFILHLNEIEELMS